MKFVSLACAALMIAAVLPAAAQTSGSPVASPRPPSGDRAAPAQGGMSTAQPAPIGQPIEVVGGNDERLLKEPLLTPGAGQK